MQWSLSEMWTWLHYGKKPLSIFRIWVEEVRGIPFVSRCNAILSDSSLRFLFLSSQCTFPSYGQSRLFSRTISPNGDTSHFLFDKMNTCEIIRGQVIPVGISNGREPRTISRVHQSTTLSLLTTTALWMIWLLYHALLWERKIAYTKLSLESKIGDWGTFNHVLYIFIV